MDFLEKQYYAGSNQLCASTPTVSRPPSLQERADFAVKEAELKLARIKEVREILSRNPDIEKLLDIMQQNPF